MRDAVKDMHESLRRLFALALEDAKADGASALAKALDEVPQTITNWGKRGVSKDGALKAQRLFGWSAAWIRHAEEPKRIGAQPRPLSKEMAHLLTDVETAPELINSGKVPVVGEVKAGLDGYLEELQYPVGHGDGTVDYWTKDRSAYALRVRNDSMHPRYRAGEFVVVTPSVEAISGNDVVVCCHDGRKLLKQLNWIRDGELQLLSINGDYGPMTMAVSDVLSIHRVAGSVGRDAFTKG